MNVVETSDRDRIERILNADRIWGAYALGDLDEPYFSRCRWFVTEPGDRALALAFRIDDWASVLLFGDPDPAPGLLRTLPAIASRTDLHLPDTHRAGVAPLVTGDLVPHVRMWLATGPAPLAPGVTATPDLSLEIPALPHGVTLRRLGPSDTAAARVLYREYAENAFSEHRLAESLYVGAEHRPATAGDLAAGSAAGSEIVAIGGTHVVSEARRVAALGDIVTLSACRGRGLGTAVTAELCRRLADRVDLVVLNVAADNHAARRAYEKVGFRTHTLHYEGADVSWARSDRPARESSS